MLRQVLFLIFCTLFFTINYAQQISRSTIGTFGSSSSNGTVTMQSSGGQVATENYKKDGVALRQGVIQPVIVSEELNALDAQVYPNPTSDLLVISFENILKENVEVSIVDMSGVLKYEEEIFQIREKQIELNNFSKGMYVLRIKKVNVESVFKIVIN